MASRVKQAVRVAIALTLFAATIPSSTADDTEGTESYGYAFVGQFIDAKPYRGQRIRLRAAVKASVFGDGNHGRLFVRVDRVDRQIGFFDNMRDRPIVSPEWNEYEIIGSLADNAEQILIGGLMSGSGRLWIDNVRLYVAGFDGEWTPVNIANPDFEDDDAQPVGWIATSPGYRFEVDEETRFRGSRSLSIVDRP